MVRRVTSEGDPVLHVVSHTHWDREWYQPFEVFRLRLVDLMDHLLQILDQEPDFVHFHLDSQCIVLEDYLAVRPDREEDLRRHIRSGRIEVGPWYVLNDLALTSGESTIRNLQLGRKMAEAFGGHGEIGYVPDQFGSIGQLPQIFAGFGLRYAVVGRGIDTHDIPVEFRWHAPDGSGVLTSFLHGWYNNAQRLEDVPTKAAQQLRRAAEHLRTKAFSRHLLLMNGVDHFEPQENLPPILAAVRPLLEPWKVVHSTLPAYFAAVEEELDAQVPVWVGELRQQRTRYMVLDGTLSSRMVLKLANHRCQLLLERWAEPWAAVGCALGQPAPRGELWLGWKHLLRNHPHDSICGCSVDAVHQDMAARFRAAEQVAEVVRRRQFEAVSARIPAPAYATVVFNPTAHARDALVTLTVDLPPGGNVERIGLTDATTGEAIPARLLRKTTQRKLVTQPTALPRGVLVDRFELRALVRGLPPFGYRTVVAEPVAGARFVYDAARAPDGPGLGVLAGGTGGRNAHLQVEIAPEGTFSVRTPDGRHLSRLGLLVDDGEAGDSYLHEAPRQDRTVVGFSGSPRIALREFGPDWLRWSIAGVLRLPKGLDSARQARSDAEVDVPVTVELTLVRGSRRLEMVVRVDNTASDHRLRILFPLGRHCETADAGSAFDVVRRPAVPPAGWEAHGTHPAERFADLADAVGGVAVLLDGTPEFGVVRQADGDALAVTLLRCTDVVGDNAGFEAAPEAQCQGPIEIRLGLMPHRGNWAEAGLWRESEEFQLPPVAFQHGQPPTTRAFALAAGVGAAGSPEEPVPNPLLAPAPPADLPLAHSFLTVQGPVVISAFKPAEDGQGVILRVFNPSDAASEAQVALDRPITRAELCDLEERAVRELEVRDGGVRYPVGGRKIVTVRLVPAS